MKSVEERLKSYEPLWENWTYTGNFLGEGAMSSVFEIESTAMGLREVAALKIITVSKNHRGEVKIPENALNEIKILRALSGCPNIVHYHDSTQRQIYDDSGNLTEIDVLIKMEKLKPLSRDDKLSEDQVIRLANDMCNALVHASEHGIIHRDIKPQNIFVDNEGTYKLGDFGISKIVSEFSYSYTMKIGTLAYTAPEVQSGTTGIYNISADIYSLGIVLYCFLNNGCMPFAHSCSSMDEAISRRLAGNPFPSPANGSKGLKSIVMRACDSDTARRYKTPQEMLKDLELLSTGGKKMVVDPFATQDANIDIDEIYNPSPSTEYDSPVSGLKIGPRRDPRTEKKSDTSSEPKTIIMTGPPEKPKPTDASGIEDSSLKRNMSKSGGLKINMGTRSPEKSKTESKPEKTDNKTPSFFTNPSL